MDQQLATTEDARRLAKNYDQDIRELSQSMVDLRAMETGPRKAQRAFEISVRAKKYLDAVEASPLREQAKRAYGIHRFLTGLVNTLRKPGVDADAECREVRVVCERERVRKLEEERRIKEAEVNRLAQEQRLAEVNHLLETGRTEQAEALMDAPVTPISVNVDMDAGKPQGEIMVKSWVPKLDEEGKFVFSDRKAYRMWIAEHPEFDYLVEDQYGKMKQLLTANRGMVQPPGLEIEQKFEPRTRVHD